MRNRPALATQHCYLVIVMKSTSNFVNFRFSFMMDEKKKIQALMRLRRMR